MVSDTIITRTSCFLHVAVVQCQDPEFQEVPLNTAATVGDSARLNCTVDWSTDRFVEWKYKNDRIYDSSKIFLAISKLRMSMKNIIPKL